MNQQELIGQLKKYSESQTPLLSLSTKEKVKKQIISNLSTVSYKEIDDSRNASWTFMFTRIAVTAVCILALLTGTTYASFNSLPGDALYPLKRTVEDAQVKFTQSQETKTKLQIKFAEKRFEELEKLETERPKTTPTPVTNNKVDVKLDTSKIDSPVATTTETKKIETEDNPKENFAKQEISRAILNLENTKSKLEKNGHAKEANNLGITIKELTSRAEKHRERNIKSKDKETPKEKTKIKNRQKEPKNEQESEENR